MINQKYNLSAELNATPSINATITGSKKIEFSLNYFEILHIYDTITL